MPTKFKFLIAYDGTKYSGWQVQPNAISIQMLIEEALQIALGKPISVTGSGRTDSGVHAHGQVAHFSSDESFDLKGLHHSLNGILPIDIRIRALAKAPEEFHARYSATGKIYRYHLHTGAVVNPFKRLYSYHFPYPFDVPLLKKAAQYFIGKHDFTSFSNEAHRGSASRNPIRTLKRLEIIEDHDDILFEFEADGFLYKMVRNIMGTLIDVARGKTPLEEIPQIFEAKDRRIAKATAPPHGLFLVKVLYDP